MDKSASKDTEFHLNEWQFMSDPFDQFISWYEQTKSAGIIKSNAMTLATSSLDGQQSVRMMVLKSFDKDGIVFFTSCRSRKRRELNPHSYAA
jgi:pyridoxamine 5'-phosphate oxidase